MPLPSATTPAWLFVLQHAPIIERYSRSRRLCRSFVESAEFQADLTENLVTAFHLLDPERLERSRPCPMSGCNLRGCSTWIYSRATLTRLRHDRHRARAQRCEPLDTIREPVSTCTDIEDFERATDAGVEVEWLLSIATPGQADAALAVLEGWDDDAPEILGISRGTYRWRLKQLGRASTAAKEATDNGQHEIETPQPRLQGAA